MKQVDAGVYVPGCRSGTGSRICRRVSLPQKRSGKKLGRTEEYARNLLDEAQRRAEEKKKESILEAKEEIIRLKNELDREIRDRRAEVQRASVG